MTRRAAVGYLDGSSKEEVKMFDLRTEAEMRLHSEKTAKELAALRKRDEELTESDTSTESATTAETDPAA
jgi:hypothetical protein